MDGIWHDHGWPMANIGTWRMKRGGADISGSWRMNMRSWTTKRRLSSLSTTNCSLAHSELVGRCRFYNVDGFRYYLKQWVDETPESASISLLHRNMCDSPTLRWWSEISYSWDGCMWLKHQAESYYHIYNIAILIEHIRSTWMLWIRHPLSIAGILAENIRCHDGMLSVVTGSNDCVTWQAQLGLCDLHSHHYAQLR